jgi:hypothetical protein
MKTRIIAMVAAGVGFLLLAACNFDFPLTAKATRPVDTRLIGNWSSAEPDGKRVEHMNVRQLDDSTYIVAYEGDIYRAYHSDWAGLPLLSVQDLNPAPDKYLYMHWQLSADGTELRLKTMDPHSLPKTAQDQAAVAQYIKDHAGDPNLFGEEAIFHRDPKPQFGR